MKITVLLENTALLPALQAEHGLSLLLETAEGKLLFDMGQTAAFAENAEKLGVDLAAVDWAVLSHGHYDHGGGIRRFLEVNDKAPLYLNRHAFEKHLSGTERDIGLDPALQGHPRLVMVGEELSLTGNMTLFSCNTREKSHALDPAGLTMLERGSIVPEDFRHEQYLLIRDGGRKILISGCSHKGILNIMDWFRPDVLVGGFHFMNLDPEGAGRAALDQAAAELLSHNAVYYTCHCTGLAQFDYLKKAMGDRLHYIAAGQQIEV